MSTKPSRRHHFLPRKFLRGFTNPDGCFHVYDKRKKRMFLTNPDSAFFENHLNSVSLPAGGNSDLFEPLYTFMEGQVWASFDKICESVPERPVEMKDKMNLFHFLTYLHWRLPSNAEYAAQLASSFFSSDPRFRFIKLKSRSGQPVDPEIVEQLRNSDFWKKAARLEIPMAPYFGGSQWHERLQAWRFIYTGDDQRWFIVGDNPIITRGVNDHDPMSCLREFVFPVSGRILLFCGDESFGTIRPPDLAFDFGVAILERSERFVACRDESFLSALVRLYELHVQYQKTDVIIPKLFETLRGRD